MTLADVLKCCHDSRTLTERRRGELISAVRTVAKGLCRLPREVPAAPGALRPLLTGITPAMASVSGGRWRNVLSLLRAALRVAGLDAAPAQCREPRSPAWQALIGQLDDFHARYRLARLSSYCTDAGIAPGGVTDAILDAFLEDLLERSIKGDVHRTHREATVEWNRNAGRLPGWPDRQLTVPDRRRDFSLPWVTFPASLHADVTAWLDRLAGKNLSDGIFGEGGAAFRPLRPASLKTRRRQIHLYLSVLVLGGVPASDLQTLADAVVPERAKVALLYMRARNGGQWSRHIHHVACMVVAIARHHVCTDPKTLERLRSFRSHVRPEAPYGMTARNQRRLMPFDDPRRVRDLLALPAQLLAEVRRAGTPTRPLALRVQAAVAVELLLMVPMRMRNLVSLRVGTDLLRGRDGGGLTVVLREEDTKNRVPLEASLPPETVRLVEIYLATYQPLLCAGGGSAWLFPRRDGEGRKSDDALRDLIQDTIRKRCGLEVHPHLFRHIAGKLTLDAQPGAYGQVRQILGHRSVDTTATYYAGMEGKAALRHYDEHVLRLRHDDDDRADAPQRSRSRRRPERRA
ncbi:tyrosine-type recombinase/integrase [Falsiroseomonas sp. CW058]|uniref:tyrosine-type recombinase/integrase n=1 Tax=Falsiroseomonas sp. CW058 TaxID=3388664 RepID=UPI003D31300D